MKIEKHTESTSMK